MFNRRIELFHAFKMVFDSLEAILPRVVDSLLGLHPTSGPLVHLFGCLELRIYLPPSYNPLIHPLGCLKLAASRSWALYFVVAHLPLA